ncbi:MAG: 50S ribosomal protein L18 [bacterium]|nr:50S ribosomal protein L18 [bacterium]
MSQRVKSQPKRERNHRKIRAKISGTSLRPRLAVFKSNTNIYAQLIDDDSGKTIAQANTRELKAGTVSEKAMEVGRAIAVKAKAIKIKDVVFDRGGYQYVGKVKAVAEGAREGGLNF